MQSRLAVIHVFKFDYLNKDEGKELLAKYLLAAHCVSTITCGCTHSENECWVSARCKKIHHVQNQDGAALLVVHVHSDKSL